MASLIKNEFNNREEFFNAVISEVSSSMKKSQSVLVASGRVLLKIYSSLEKEDYLNKRFYLADERLVDVGSDESNYKAISSAMKGVNLFKFNYPPDDIERGLGEYGKLIEDEEEISLALFSGGEDGHIASLFDGKYSLNENRLYIQVLNSPKPPPNRVSISVACIKRIKKAVVLFSGEEKNEAYKRFLRGKNTASLLQNAKTCVSFAYPF